MNFCTDNLVSVIMPCRNSASTISQSVSSVLDQTYPDWELLIVDDGSVDSTLRCVESLAKYDSRIRVFENNTSQHGPSVARNIALAHASGRFISFLDSDDYWDCDALSRRIELMHQSGAKIVFGAYYRLLPSGRKNLVNAKERVTFCDMLSRNHIGNLTGLYDAEVLGKEYQKNVRHEDYLMWCCLLERAGFALSVPGKALGVYRVTPTSLSSNKWRAFHWHWTILRTELGLPFGAALLHQARYALHAALIRL